MRFKYLRILLEDYKRTLRNKGVDAATIRYVETFSNQDKGKAIAKLMANPKLNKDELTQDEFRVRSDTDHMFILAADPTATKIDRNAPPGDYYRIIAKWMKDGTIRLDEDRDRLREVLDYYNKNKNRFKTKYISKYKTFQDLEQEYLDVSGRRSKRQEIKDMKMEGAKKLHEDSTWILYEITTPEAACYYGKGTRWCTTNSNTAKAYLHQGPLYIFINKKTGEKFQATNDLTQFMDENDRDIISSEPNHLYDIFVKVGFIFHEKEIGYYRIHRNGGGKVGIHATVEKNCFIEKNAAVYDSAIVYDNAKIRGNARIYGRTNVSGNAEISGNARVSENAQVYGNARVFGNARVYGDARVSENAQVYGNALVYGRAQLTGHVTISGDAEIGGNVSIDKGKYIHSGKHT